MWNPAAERIFGWSEEEVLGEPYPLVPEEKEHEFRANIARALQGDSLTGLETRRQKKDGTQIDVSIWTAPSSRDRFLTWQKPVFSRLARSSFSSGR